MPLSSHEWNSNQVVEAIDDIYQSALEFYSQHGLWSGQSDESLPSYSIYQGAAGTLWALVELSRSLGKSLPFDALKVCDDIHQLYLQYPDLEKVTPSLFLGESGILMIRHLISPTTETELKLYELVKDNEENIVLEALWGSPGTILIASWFCQKGRGQAIETQKWIELYRSNASWLIERLKSEVEKGEDLWMQDIYGHQLRFLGAGHGYMGNIYGLFKRQDLLTSEQRDFLLSHTEEVLRKYSMSEGELTNWPIRIDESEKVLVQWCHGAPGIITALKNFPADEKLLLSAGELTWSAGPLNKGVGICHGTDGNGFAFLQLYKRTGDRMWLERARAFAMHSLSQRTHTHSLFLGDLGLALYLRSCLDEDDRFPLLDYL